MTFAPRVARAVVPGARFVTRLENLEAPRFRPWRQDPPARVAREAARVLAGRRGLDPAFGALLRDSHRLIAVSEVHRTRLSRMNPALAARCVVIPPAPLLGPLPGPGTREGFRARMGARPDDIVLAYVGYLYPEKGFDKLLRALERTADPRGTLRLAVFAAPVPAFLPPQPAFIADMKRLVEARGLEPRVQWLGTHPWNSAPLMEALVGADVCVLPHDYGVQLNNRALAAACVAGLPTIAIRGPIEEPALSDGDNIVLCARDSIDDLADAIGRMAGDCGLRERVRRGAGALGRRFYDRAAAADQTAAVIRDAASAGASAGALAVSTE
jgi:glycosyltransferase involved in cell wall biosynthesis